MIEVVDMAVLLVAVVLVQSRYARDLWKLHAPIR